MDAYKAVANDDYLHGEFITIVQKRGAEIIARRKVLLFENYRIMTKYVLFLA
jgi:hypothetical protein